MCFAFAFVSRLLGKNEILELLSSVRDVCEEKTVKLHLEYEERQKYQNQFNHVKLDATAGSKRVLVW